MPDGLVQLVAPGEQYGEYEQELRDFFHPHLAVFAPGFGPGDARQVSMTRQEFAVECDINEIMRRHEKAGTWPLPPNDHVPQYLDLSDLPDLFKAQQIMIEGERAFMTLPAVVRRTFDNNPMEFVEFASNPANLDQMRAWGLAAPVAPSIPPGPPEAAAGGLAPPVKPPAPTAPPASPEASKGS